MKSPANLFEDTEEMMRARHDKWLSGEIRPLNRWGDEATRDEIEDAIREQLAKAGLV